MEKSTKYNKACPQVRKSISCLTKSLLIVIIFASCEDFLKIDPPKTATVSSSIYTADATAVSAIIAI